MAEAANIDTPISTILSTSTPTTTTTTTTTATTTEIDYDYYDYYKKENITEVMNTPTSNFSILGLDKDDSIVLMISFAVIALCIVALVIAIVLKFKKIKCSFNIQKKSADIELNRMYAPLVQNPSLFDSVDLVTPSDEI